MCGSLLSWLSEPDLVEINHFSFFFPCSLFPKLELFLALTESYICADMCMKQFEMGGPKHWCLLTTFMWSNFNYWNK